MRHSCWPGRTSGGVRNCEFSFLGSAKYKSWQESEFGRSSSEFNLHLWYTPVHYRIRRITIWASSIGSICRGQAKQLLLLLPLHPIFPWRPGVAYKSLVLHHPSLHEFQFLKQQHTLGCRFRRSWNSQLRYVGQAFPKAGIKLLLWHAYMPLAIWYVMSTVC